MRELARSVLRSRRPAHPILIAVLALVAALLWFGAPSSEAGGANRTQVAAKPATGFESSVSKLSAKRKRKMTGVSWRRGCPVGLGDLRLLRVEHWDWTGDVENGSIVVHRNHARRIEATFRRLYRQRFPIRKMNLIDRYGGSDHRSMDADNTSGFNCREVAGRPGVWSQHAYGRAIDINPIENPYVTSSGYVSPPAGRPYADRSPTRKGMVTKRAIRAFRESGWKWGGKWRGTKDYQHFSSNGR
ncbi:M15 family metallopeptidase [Thermoleophilia bacterium SCSIO 60948]|nr:M15 family metallopeptidase [Thermoleophilia bacterium SCSIO 60948]